jgi:hypothetical protein
MGEEVSITFRAKSFFLIYMRIMYKNPLTHLHPLHPKTLQRLYGKGKERGMGYGGNMGYGV